MFFKLEIILVKNIEQSIFIEQSNYAPKIISNNHLQFILWPTLAMMFYEQIIPKHFVKAYDIIIGNLGCLDKYIPW